MKNTKITTIELWRFILTVAIALGHLNTFVWLDTGENLIFTGGRVLAFFMFLSGYFLMAHYKKQKTSGKNKNVSAAKQTWEYIKSRFKALYPALFMGVLLAFIVRNAISGTKITEIFGVFMDSIWEFLGISQIGAVGLLELKSITFDPVLGVSYLWNGPLWYISALILAGLILYYIVSKSEDFFTGFFAPVFVIITYASAEIYQSGPFHNCDTPKVVSNVIDFNSKSPTAPICEIPKNSQIESINTPNICAIFVPLIALRTINANKTPINNTGYKTLNLSPAYFQACFAGDSSFTLLLAFIFL